MTHVFVGMSGGVDSSVAASLLLEQGYKVTGIYMKNWSQDLPGMKCPWAEDLADAKRVAVQLGIDFKVYDFENEYRQKVVQYMLNEYQAGHTPNPDVMCNQEIKFKLFLETALGDGAGMIATGHYTRAENGQLLRAKDEAKDQTYFLYRINRSALEKTLFPLGNYLKSEVRELAQERGLWTARKKESMGVCFVGSVDMRDFLSEFIETEPGDIIDRDSGKKLGRHDGAIFYTLGQRHGLSVGGGLPYYVVGKNVDQNQVFVSTNLDSQSLWLDEVNLTHLHWIDQKPADGEYQVRVRHQAKLIKAKLAGEKLHLFEAQRAVTAGQSTVIYKDNICLGGGIIS